MLNTIQINLNALEHMIFFWQSVMDREKVGEYYLSEVAGLPEMAVLYDGEFNGESVRKVLSAITNREVLNTDVAKEKQFWNNNMRMTEDRGLLEAMIFPLKTLNLDFIKEQINQNTNVVCDDVEIIFIPGFKETVIIKDNQLYINFFKVMVDVFGGTGAVTIEGKEPPQFIFEQIVQGFSS